MLSEELGTFGDDDVSMLELLSLVLSSAMSHAAEFEAKREQVEALALFEAVYTGAPIGVMLVSPEGRNIESNPAFLEMLGYTSDELARQHAEWAEQGMNVAISYNLSPRQMWTANLAEKLLGKLQVHDVDPNEITIEITESMAMSDPDRTQRLLTELHSWGFTLAIDDFGTGYSSLARLKHMPVDVLKIDQAFVRNVEYDRDLAGMVRAMIQLAQGVSGAGRGDRGARPT